jgi:hypothetical protein
LNFSRRKRPFGTIDEEIKVLTVKNGEGQELKEARYVSLAEVSF